MNTFKNHKCLRTCRFGITGPPPKLGALQFTLKTEGGVRSTLLYLALRNGIDVNTLVNTIYLPPLHFFATTLHLQDGSRRNRRGSVVGTRRARAQWDQGGEWI